MTQINSDFDFLLKAANYGGGTDAPHSESARKAVDMIAERFRLISDVQLKIATERVNLINPKEIAAKAEAEGADLL